MRILIRQETTYRYETPANYSVQALRLRPLDHASQKVLSWRVVSSPAGTMRESRDAYGNVVQMLYLEKLHDELTLSVSGEVETSDAGGVVGGMAGAAAIGVITSLWIGAGSPAQLALIGIGMTVLEQAGDFFESALKRRAGVKDSGTLIPGHGGILDRVDGLVAVAAGAALLALLHNATHPGAGVLIWP